MARLVDREVIARRANGTWLLADESRALLNTAPVPRLTLGIEVLGRRAPAPVDPRTIVPSATRAR